MKKVLVILTILALCLCSSFALAQDAQPAEGTPLTVYVKNTANWDIINIYAWDNFDGAATDMEWVETPMEDMGNGWKTYTLNTFGKEFFLCFQNGGPVWTNDVPVQAGTTVLCLDLTDAVKADKQVCQYTEEAPEGVTLPEAAATAAAEETAQTTEKPAAEEPVKEGGVELTVYVKNTAAWDIINIYAWDDYNGEATNLEWVENPMIDMENGWKSFTLTTWKEFYLCFQDGGSMWTNDVPVEAGVTEVYLELTDKVKGDRQVCQYTDVKPE